MATRLLGHGAGAVVAMGYSVAAVAAAELMAVFYEGAPPLPSKGRLTPAPGRRTRKSRAGVMTGSGASEPLH